MSPRMVSKSKRSEADRAADGQFCNEFFSSVPDIPPALTWLASHQAQTRAPSDLRGPFVAPHRKRVARQIPSDNLDPSHGYLFQPSRAPPTFPPSPKNHLRNPSYKNLPSSPPP